MRPLGIVVAALVVAGCGGGDEPTLPLSCGDGLEVFEGRCVDPARRYEPDAPLDQDNVVAYGDPLTQLDLPAPPRSGFRIIAPPRVLQPGEEVDFCLSWPIPELQRHVVYAGRVYTTPGLHHSNVIAKPIDPDLGPNPYPACNPGADDPFNRLPEVIPDVLFANSTQVVGTETLAFPPGDGWKVDTTREISTNIHLLNPSTKPQTVEVAYDFFTMPDERLVHEVAPFLLQVNDFLIPPHTTGTVGGDCRPFGGEVVTMMMHTHRFATSATVDFLHGTDPSEQVLDDGRYDQGSDIHLYQPPLDLAHVSAIRYACTFENTTDHDIVYGLGENEMCVLFGYVWPVEKQFVGYSDYQGEPCKTYDIGLFR